jgi:hypothetical protein
MRQEREVARHLAVGSDGTEYEVIEIQEYDERRTINGEWIRIDGFRRLELDDGSFVNRKDAETFEIVSTGEIIRKIG